MIGANLGTERGWRWQDLLNKLFECSECTQAAWIFVWNFLAHLICFKPIFLAWRKVFKMPTNHDDLEYIHGWNNKTPTTSYYNLNHLYKTWSKHAEIEKWVVLNYSKPFKLSNILINKGAGLAPRVSSANGLPVSGTSMTLTSMLLGF